MTAPRANWCPDAVCPIVAPLPQSALAPGEHHARFAIDAIHSDGRWQVALALHAFAQ